MLGCPRAAQPANFTEFRAYWDHMVNTIEVTDTARKVAQAVLYPQLPVLAKPLLAGNRFLTAGLLPEPIRRQYGLLWDERRERILRGGARIAARIVPHLPRPLREAPKTYYLKRARRKLARAH